MDFGEAISYGVPPKPDFWVGRRATGDGFRESHIAFAAPGRVPARRDRQPSPARRQRVAAAGTDASSFVEWSCGGETAA
jgi:hypothetical protein